MKNLQWIEHLALVILFVLTLLLGALVLSLWWENEGLKIMLEETEIKLEKTKTELQESESTLEDKKMEIQEQKEEISDLNDIIEEKELEIEDLKEELNESEADLEETMNVLSEAKEEINEIKEEAEDLEERISQSIQWFTDNSELPKIYKTDRLMGRIERGCVKGGKLRLACISYLMEDELDIRYKDDPGDKLYSLEEIIERKGGDCEDFSLFFKAIVNELDYEFEAWESNGERYEVYEDENVIWYYDDAKGVEIGRDLNAYPVCYYYGTSGGTLLGHCVVMFTDKAINSPEDISTETLMDAKLVEPQNGEYIGKVGEKFSVCPENCQFEPYSIAFIITDNDLYHVDEKWDYYHGSKERVEEIIEQLSKWSEISS